MTRRLRASDFDPPARTFTQRLVRNMGQDYVPRDITGQPMQRANSGRATDYDPQPRTFTQYLVSRMNGDVYERKG